MSSDSGCQVEAMDISNALALGAAILTLAYLLYALLRPEQF
ncbi:hypothetical protein GCM10009551_073250 [Nocardiopsis tropica]|nr:hypothetical protein TTY48_28610 [Tsukamurella sp. TY48]